MPYFESVGLKPVEIVVKASCSGMAKYYICNYVSDSYKFYMRRQNDLLDVDEIYSKQKIAEYDRIAAQMRKAGKNRLMYNNVLVLLKAVNKF